MLPYLLPKVLGFVVRTRHGKVILSAVVANEARPESRIARDTLSDFIGEAPFQKVSVSRNAVEIVHTPFIAS